MSSSIYILCFLKSLNEEFSVRLPFHRVTNWRGPGPRETGKFKTTGRLETGTGDGGRRTKFIQMQILHWLSAWSDLRRPRTPRKLLSRLFSPGTIRRKINHQGARSRFSRGWNFARLGLKGKTCLSGKRAMFFETDENCQDPTLLPREKNARDRGKFYSG